jgi:hypothetical protein
MEAEVLDQIPAPPPLRNYKSGPREDRASEGES